MIQATVVGQNNDSWDNYSEPYVENVNDTNVNVEDNISDDDFVGQFSKLFGAFANEIPNGSHEQKSAKNFFKNFANYVGSDTFKDDLTEKSEKYKVPKKQLAKNFFLKILGIIGDILGIVVNTVCGVLDLAVVLLNTLLHGAVGLIHKVASGIVGVVTLNQTAS